MALDEKQWRPITFEGVTFPATLMGVSMLGSVLNINDEELGDWLWRLPICKGVTKRRSAEMCNRCAQKMIDLMLEHRQRVLDAIRELLGPHGFDADTTFVDWITAFQQIRNLSAKAESECIWSAPSHPEDKPADWQAFMLALERERERLTKSGSDEPEHN
jgi:hypothetical protein